MTAEAPGEVEGPGILALPEQQAGMVPDVFVVVDRRQELDDTVTLQIKPQDGGNLGFLPGQFTMMGLPGVGEVPISISGHADDNTKLVQTIRSVGRVTRALTKLEGGDRLTVRGPFGKPWPVELALGRKLLIVAGGLGLAPVRPIVLWALANHHRLAGVELHYGSRSPENILFRGQLLGWLTSGRIDGSVIVDRHSGDWAGPVGPVTELITRSHTLDTDRTIVMICGPEIMMRFVIQALEARGLAESAMWVSMERNMKCGIGWCGHCQLGPMIVCRDGPVFRVDQVRALMARSEL